MRKHLKENSFKFYNAILILLGFVTYWGVNLYWEYVCKTGQCTVMQMDGFLSPLEEAGLWIGLFAVFLILLPQIYFKRWLQWFLWWALPVSVWLNLEIDPRSSSILSISREEGVQLLAVAWVVGTLVVIALTYYNTRRS